MKSVERDGKGKKPTGHSLTTAAGDSLKQPWQTPEIFEEDYRETDAAAGPVGDGFAAS